MKNSQITNLIIPNDQPGNSFLSQNSSEINQSRSEILSITCVRYLRREILISHLSSATSAAVSALIALHGALQIQILRFLLTAVRLRRRGNLLPLDDLPQLLRNVGDWKVLLHLEDRDPVHPPPVDRRERRPVSLPRRPAVEQRQVAAEGVDDGVRGRELAAEPRDYRVLGVRLRRRDNRRLGLRRRRRRIHRNTIAPRHHSRRRRHPVQNLVEVKYRYRQHAPLFRALENLPIGLKNRAVLGVRIM
ncbi:fumarate hydratase class II [Striga asiatica]|uniref:Fumarate hydratase class II n=1 Tax=Striga asiatica TaxID=4170 RepID=A0A5A7P1U4_STRAF|nr:fumarate hydratase class II [Striga asiatica]